MSFGRARSALTPSATTSRAHRKKSCGSTAPPAPPAARFSSPTVAGTSTSSPRSADVRSFPVRNPNYGMSEVMSNFASQCDHTNDLHFHGGDAVFTELIDAAGNSLPLREGATGELVCTHIEKECQPLLRYRTRDVV